MSVHVISWVLRHSEARLGERLVLIVLADHADGDGDNAFPSVETIGREALLSERQVQRCLRDLESDGFIQDMGASEFGTTTYRVVMEGGRQYVAPPQMGDDIHDTQGVTNRTGDLSEMSPKPSLLQPTTKPSTNDSLVGTPEARRLAELLVTTVNSRGLPGKKVTVTNQTVQAIERMERIDKVPYETIERFIIWLDESNHREAQFWRGVIRSGVKLREHFGTVAERVRGQRTPAASPQEEAMAQTMRDLKDEKYRIQ